MNRVEMVKAGNEQLAEFCKLLVDLDTFFNRDEEFCELLVELIGECE